MGAIQFIENMDRTTLTISDEEFEANVEAAVSAIAEKHRLESPVLQPQTQGPSDPTQLSEKSRGASGTTSARAGPQSTRNSTEKPSSSSSSARPSFDGAPQTPGASTPRRSGEGAAGPDSGQSEDAGQAMPIANLLRSIQKPLSTIGRMFTDEGSAAVGSGSPSTASASASLLGTNPSARARTPDGRTRPLSSIAGTGTVGQRAKSTSSAHQAGGGEAVVRPRSSRNASTSVLSAEEAAARQASAEAAEAQRLSRAEHATIVETLAGMFPDLDKDVISDVVHQKEGR